MQSLQCPDETKWSARILPNRTLLSACQSEDSRIILKLGFPLSNRIAEEELEVDYVFTATGYRRNAHQEMLSGLKPMLSMSSDVCEKLSVSRNYEVQYDEEKIDKKQAGIWLQGCNEETHGVSSQPRLTGANSYDIVVERHSSLNPSRQRRRPCEEYFRRGEKRLSFRHALSS